MFRRNLSLVLALVFLINLCSPLFSVGAGLMEDDLKVLAEQNENLQIYIDIVDETLSNPTKYLVYESTDKGIDIAIYNTPDSNIMLAYTNGVMDIVEKTSEDEYMINGIDTIKVESVESSEENNIRPLGWNETGNAPGPWKFEESVEKNIAFGKLISGIAIGTAASIISSIFGLKLRWDLAIGLATALVSSAYAPYGDASFVRLYKYINLPFYRKDSAHCYVKKKTNGQLLFVENIVKYYAWTPGGP